MPHPLGVGEGLTVAYDTTINIAESIKKQKMLGYQNAILLAISHISSILLQSSRNTYVSDLHRALEIMGEAAEVDRVYIWENHTKDGELFASQTYEWSAGAEPQQDKELVKNVSYKHDIPIWWEQLSSGSCINGLVSERPESERVILAAQGIISVLTVPIFFHEQFWGFVGFDDCHAERAFSANEERILRSASELIANALIRNHIEENAHYLELEVGRIHNDSLKELYNKRYFDDKIEQINNTAAINLAKNAFDSLSGQEMRLAELIIQGYTNPEIAKSLKITDNTVRYYRKSLYSKLQIHSRRELFELAERAER
jgi:DNA-binding CsgD family transcriptional regulator